jgi:hypothetical protein
MLPNTKLLLALLFLPLAVRAQKFPEHREPAAAQNKGTAILLHLGAGAQLPGGDLADRFGFNGAIGPGVEIITASNYLVGLEGQYLFGQKVHEDPLTPLRTPEGDIIGNDQQLAQVALRERGWYAGAHVGRLFTFGAARSGLRITLGGGWFQHKIRVQDDAGVVPGLAGDYIKGYDRLTGGPALNEFIGWQHLAANRRSNWMIGLELGQAFTNTRRDWDFAERRKLDGKRLDLRFGIKAMWTLPFYLGGANEIYY